MDAGLGWARQEVFFACTYGSTETLCVRQQRRRRRGGGLALGALALLWWIMLWVSLATFKGMNFTAACSRLPSPALSLVLAVKAAPEATRWLKMSLCSLRSRMGSWGPISCGSVTHLQIPGKHTARTYP